MSNRTTVERPIGSQGQELAQSAVAPYPLLVNVAPGVPLAVDVIDRAARLLGVVYGSQGVQLVQDAAAANALTVQDTGLHTNPRRYEKDNGFTSARVAVVGPAATPLWVVGLAAVYPVAGRTAGEITTVYTLVIENPTGVAITGWLEVGGAAITPVYHMNNAETMVVTFAAGMNIGNVNINCNASAATVVFQLVGTEA